MVTSHYVSAHYNVKVRFPWIERVFDLFWAFRLIMIVIVNDDIFHYTKKDIIPKIVLVRSVCSSQAVDFWISETQSHEETTEVGKWKKD